MKEKLLKNKVLVLISILIVISIIFLYTWVDINSFLEDKGFKKYDESMYYKKLSSETKEQYEKQIKKGVSSEYDYLYFGLGTYHLSEEVGVYDQDVKLEYIGEYNYKNNLIVYSIRGEYNSTTIQFSGNYYANNKKFTCISLLHHDIEYDDELNNAICDLTKYHSIKLYKNSIKLMDDDKVLQKVITKTE